MTKTETQPLTQKEKIDAATQVGWALFLAAVILDQHYHWRAALTTRVKAWLKQRDEVFRAKMNAEFEAWDATEQEKRQREIDMLEQAMGGDLGVE